MKVSELRVLDIVNIEDGRRLGPVIDLDLDLEKGLVKGIVIMTGYKGKGFFSGGRGGDVLIPWDKVLKIGVDVILVDGKDLINIAY
ncbi:YlmC/YmxH family sporulation protein [Dehalobacter sp. DCM]|uniref:YlmC/YmxH family sporulation protein n=1 Tax=Dehalobacter sp. DCM TaxID=2907827 RepID=UPI003081812C|nr:YlmC/YmxH family sporulation protein [Dehalobacter sp. DCM]